MKKRKTPLWLGYLEAGSRSSPVVRDSGLDTGNSTTIYLFNLMRGRILEYRKDIVELKLRELTLEETSMVKPLIEAFREARAGFLPRGRKLGSPIGGRIKKRDPEIPDPDNDGWPSLDGDKPKPFTVDQLY